MSSDAQKLTVSFVRDMATCTRDEMFQRWQGPMRKAIEKIHGSLFDTLVPETHNPIYFLAENLFFDNVRDNPNFLYAPMHRDIICEATLGYLLNDQSFQHPQLQRPVNDDNGFLLLTQRDSFKSTFKHGVDPMFCALRAKHVEDRDVCCALVHQKEFQASRNLMRIKRKTRSHPWLKRYFPEFMNEQDYGTQTDFNYACVDPSSPRAEPSVHAGGISADFTGLHYDYLFMSDLVVKDHRMSEHLRNTTEALYDALMYTVDMKSGKVLHDGTFYHQHDLWHKMVRSKQYVVLNIPAGGHDNEPLSHPHRHSMDVLKRIQRREKGKSGNDDMYWMQMQLRVKTSRLMAGNSAWYKPMKASEIPSGAWHCIFVDPAWKGDRNSGRGDNASIQVWAIWSVGQYFHRALRDGVTSNALSVLDGEREIFRLMRRYSVIDVAPERSSDYSFVTALENDAGSRGQAITILEMKSRRAPDAKNRCIVVFLKEVQAGRVYICDEADENTVQILKNETDDFPMLEHDDVIDCASFTTDTNIAENFAPIIEMQPDLEPDQPQMTRYSGF